VINRVIAVPLATCRGRAAAIAIRANAADAIVVADARSVDVSQVAADVTTVPDLAVIIVTILILAIVGRGTAIGTRAMALVARKAGAVYLKPSAMIRAERGIVCREVRIFSVGE
jgi:hypothetical protein